MSIFEYDQEAHMKCVRQEGYEYGLAEGISQGISESILELLDELGTIPDSLKDKILHESDIQKLKHWHKLAAKVESIEQFINNI